jgi:hypothetical protein
VRAGPDTNGSFRPRIAGGGGTWPCLQRPPRAELRARLNGEEVPKTVVLDTKTVTEENAAAILKANGLM